MLYNTAIAVRTARTVAAGVAAFMLLSCGYSIRPEPLIKTLSIGPLDNRTREPGLSDALRTALTRELMARGVTVAEGQGTELSGTIESLEVTPLSERGGSIVKFSVTLKGAFMLVKGPDGDGIPLSAPLSYLVSFGSDVQLDPLYSMRQEAVRRAVDDLAADLAAAAVIGR